MRILRVSAFYLLEVRTISKEKMINGAIRARQVRVIDENGEMKGIMDTRDALRMAKPPVCKILDYGKYRYELQKKDKIAKKNQKTMQIKEIRLSTFIEDHDIQVKAKTAAKFLNEGDKVKVSLRFRGRERDYTSKGYDVMNRFAEEVSEVGVVDKKPKFEGRSLTMFLAPKK